MADITVLRTAVHRLMSVPVKDLPPIAACLATSLVNCRSILSTALNAKGSATDTEAFLLVQKLKTRITSLLQDRTVEGRWTAVILVKAAVEAGQWEILHSCANWVRNLLTILGRPDPSTTKQLCIIALTRIYQLTHSYPTVIREITTPTLPSFITTCLNQLSARPSSGQSRRLDRNPALVHIVLRCFLELIYQHPATFRPFSTQIRDIVIQVFGPTDSFYSEATVATAQELFISLHLCAAKNTGAEEWTKSCKATIYTIHKTCNHLFRAVAETWETVDPTVKSIPSAPTLGIAGDDSENPLNAPAWHGVPGGSQRLRSLIRLLSKFVAVTTQSTVSIPVGSLLDVTARMINVFAPPANAPGSVTLRPEIGKEEREALWCELPAIHAEVLNLLRSIVTSFGIGSLPICQSCLDQLMWVFELGKGNEQLRNTAYSLLDAILPIIGPSMTKGNVVSLTPVFRNACYDILASSPTRSNEGISQHKLAGKSASNAANADSYLNLGPSKEDATPNSTIVLSQLVDTALHLLTHALAHLPTEYFPTSLRTEIDRTAVIGGCQSIIMASVSNPAINHAGQQTVPSLLPFLARLSPDSPDVEGLLRPRMPVILGAPGALDQDNEEEEEEEEAEADESGKYSYQAPARHIAMDTTENVFESSLADTRKRSTPVAEPSQSEDTQAKRQRVNKDEAPAQNQQLPESGAGSTATTTQTTTSNSPPMHKDQVDRTIQHAQTPDIVDSKSSEMTDIRGDTQSDFQSVEVSIPAPLTSANPAAPKGGQPEGTEDSDEEIPTLNIESDSDDALSDD